MDLNSDRATPDGENRIEEAASDLNSDLPTPAGTNRIEEAADATCSEEPSPETENRIEDEPCGLVGAIAPIPPMNQRRLLRLPP